MNDPSARCEVVVDQLPARTLRAAVEYLDDVRRECQLVLSSVAQGEAANSAVAELALGLVPDIEEVADAFRAATLTKNADGTMRLAGTMTVGQSATLADLQVQLIQLRLLGRRGGLLVESDPQVSQFLAWIWEELADQLHGRPPRVYRPAT